MTRWLGLKNKNTKNDVQLYDSLGIVFIGGEVMEIGLKDSEPKCRSRKRRMKVQGQTPYSLI